MYTDITFKVIGSTVVFTTTTKVNFHLIAVLSFNHFYSGRYHLSLLLWSVPLIIFIVGGVTTFHYWDL